MTTPELAYYIWDYLKRHDGERSADENWFLAEEIMRGDRRRWLFDQEDFKPFTTGSPFGYRLTNENYR